MRIPQDFMKRLSDIMKPSEYNDFIEALHQPRTAGLRVNRLKVDLSSWLLMTPFKLEAIPWTQDGYYLEENDKPGKHPYYHTGVYYIQEPSAMFPAELMNVKPGDRVLDLCAAPGGKTGRLAADMKNRGFLLSNDLNPKRVKVLEKNIELSGITNAVVTNESPERLSQVYKNYFDRILLDVPCSGEGMFRKGGDAWKSWNRYKAEEMQSIQRNIFESAYQMLSPGGTVVYSTCTFNPEENEKNIAYFLKTYPDLYLKEIKKIHGIESGRPEWADNNPELLKTSRLWPHKVKGEGHFVALMGRLGEKECHLCSPVNTEPPDTFKRFCDEMLTEPVKGNFSLKGAELNILPEGYNAHPKLKVVKTGLYTGHEDHGRFEPSESLAMALQWNMVKRKESFSLDDMDLLRYLKGETLFREGEKGHVLLGVECFPLGWGKIGENGLKNLYPRGWRKTR